MLNRNIRNLILVFILCLLVVWAIPPFALPGESYISGTASQCNVQSDQDCYQTFTCSRAMNLTNLTFSITTVGTPTKPTEVLIYSTSIGLINILIANWTPIPASFDPSSFTEFNSSGNVSCALGQVLGVVLHTGNAANNQHSWADDGVGTYANGTGGYANGNLGGFTPQTNDRWFKTWFNWTGASPPAPPDTSPAGFINCSMTSEGLPGYRINISNGFCAGVGCNVPRTNDTTPTVSCYLNKTGNMTIIDLGANLNYTDIYRGNANGGNGTGDFVTATLNDTNRTRVGLQTFCLAAVDANGNQNGSCTWRGFFNITKASGPNTTLNGPPNGVSFRLDVNNTITFNYTTNDTYDPTLSCVGYINNVAVYTNTSTLNATPTIFRSTQGVGSYTWYVNCTDSFNNVNQSEIRTFTVNAIASVACTLNGSHSNKSYEQYLTRIGLPYAINYTCTVQPNATICVDYDYMINWSCFTGNFTLLINVSALNNTKFVNGTFAINSSTPYNITIKQDNNTDIISIAFKIQGYSPYPTNVFLSFSNKTIFAFPGKIKETEAEYNEFIYSGVKYNATNITVALGGTGIIQSNTSNSLPMKNATIYVSGYNLDGNNEFTKTITFTLPNPQNTSLSIHADAPLGVFDDFVSNNSIWGGDESTYEVIEISGIKRRDLSYGPTGLSTSSDVFKVQCGGDVETIDMYTIPSSTLFDWRNISVIVMDFVYDNNREANGKSENKIYLTDGTNRLETWSITRASGTGQSPTRSSDYARVYFTKISDTQFTISGNVTCSNCGGNANGGGTFSTTSLDANEQWTFEFYTKAEVDVLSSNCQKDNFAQFILRQINQSGIWLQRNTTNGTYYSVGNSSYCALNVTPNNVSKIVLEWNQFKPAGTDVFAYVSNTCNSSQPIWENTISGQSHTFATVGNNIGVRFALNSSTNISSPTITSFTAQVVKSSISNISLDCDGDVDPEWTYEGALNSTTSPKVANCSIFNSCASGLTCMRTFTFTSDGGGILSIDNVSITQSLAELTVVNKTPFEFTTYWNISAAANANGAALRAYDLVVKFNGSQNKTLFAHTAESSSLLLGTDNLTALIYFSKLKSTFPKGVTYFQPQPTSNNQRNIPIYGQTIRACNTFTSAKCAVTSTPIFNVSSYAYDLPFDLYINTNVSYNTSCFNYSFDLGVNRTTALQTNTTPQLMASSIQKVETNVNNSKRIFGFVDYYNATQSCEREVKTNVFEWRGYCVGGPAGDCVR